MNDRKWRVIPGQALHHYAWDEQYLVFNNLSGDTHLLDAGAMQLLLAVHAAPATGPALASRLCAELQLDDAELLEIPPMLDDLRALSLIELAPC
ncbi:HPr-rel-A system PqqD family peptide chaperone [Massilia cavernae]|uniref:HPr-rel-A system PqqD family peptide chaperone n=1 Tax=Massilia cavernae TaxID=2320864 RepID=UPI00160257CE|nr:HPr-rel-A system PqqD family peptide chaperone [Massilia cavernae]